VGAPPRAPSRSDFAVVTDQAGWLERVGNAIASTIERGLALALIGGIALNFTNVAGRYLFGFALTGADEIEIYILVCIAFLGAAIVTWRRAHLRMDVLVGACPDILRRGVALLETTVLVVVAAFVTVQSARYVEKMHALGAVSDIAHVPIWMPHSAIVIGFGAMTLIAIVCALRNLIGTRRSPSTAPSNSESKP
jgi:TRAP-type transport system small permease protein